MILPYSFYEHFTIDVAKAILGKTLKFSIYEGMICDVEAYLGMDDPASHASMGYTMRNSTMFGPGGFSYVYLIYGIHYCLNIVTDRFGSPGAILIRGVKVFNPININLDGPGKLCKELGINKNNNAIDLTSNYNFCILDTNSTNKQFNYTSLPRVGIKKGSNMPWRFKICEI